MITMSHESKATARYLFHSSDIIVIMIQQGTFYYNKMFVDKSKRGEKKREKRGKQSQLIF